MKTTDLKPLFWKEWHEHIRWALLALLALSLGLAYAEYRQSSQSALTMVSQIWSSINLVLTLVAPLVGLALGLLQILPELRRDQWAFLVHRPVSRTTLFFGKVLPGVCLYLLATSLPLLGFAFWAAFPSHIPAPFDVRFTLAGWAAILSGLPFYFAGLLVALRPARWYGSRALPILAAVAGPWAANKSGEFWQAALTCLLITLVLLLAAWGSFVTGGEYKEQTKPARFALGLTLYPAVVAVSFGLLMLLAGGYNLFAKPTGSGNEWWNTEYKIDTQGRIFEASEHGMDSAHQERKTLTVTDLAGHSVDPEAFKNLQRQDKLLETQYLSLHQDTENLIPAYQQTDRYVSYLTSDYGEGISHSWYYDSHSQQIVQYTVHLLSPSFTTITYLGPNGFSESRRQAGQFPEGLPSSSFFAGQHLLSFPHAIYWYDTSRPAVGLLHASPSPGAILGVQNSLGDQDMEGYGTAAYRASATAFFVASSGQITVYARTDQGAAPESTRKLFTTPMVSGSFGEINVATMPDLSRFFFWYQAKGPAAAGQVVTVAADGRVLKTETLPSSLSYPVPEKSQRLIAYAPGVFFPPFSEPAFMAFISIGHLLNWSSAQGAWDSRDTFGWAFLFSCLSGLVAAVLAWRISRRCGDSRRGQIAWTIGIFWLGLYGVLLLLALRAWPARIPCPNCKRLRVVDRALCEHCGAAFAKPKRDGTEIFDKAGEAEPTPAR